MKWEFIGSIIIILVSSLLKDVKHKKIPYLILFILLHRNYVNLTSFVLGAFIDDSHLYNNKLESALPSKGYYHIIKTKAFMNTLLIFGIFLTSIPQNFVGIYRVLSKIPHNTSALTRSIGISFLFFYVLNNHNIQKILTTRFFLELGKISGYIYVLHWPIMLSIQHYLFQKLILLELGFNISALVSFVVTLPIIILSAVIANKLFKFKFTIRNGIIVKTSNYNILKK